jgi:nucleoid-associated protein YgaU
MTIGVKSNPRMTKDSTTNSHRVKSNSTSNGISKERKGDGKEI